MPFPGKFPSESKSSAAKLLLTCLVAAERDSEQGLNLILFSAKEESCDSPLEENSPQKAFCIKNLVRIEKV